MKLELTKPKVAIIGCSTCKDLAPFNDGTWEFWGVNNLFHSIPGLKWDKWFEIHYIEKVGNIFHRRWSPDFRGQKVDDYMRDLAKLPCPVIMQKHWDEIPLSIPYPLKEIVDTFGNYITNTISFEIALALFLGAKEIGIWGVDMAVGTGKPSPVNPGGGEYSHQRPSCEYFIGLARGMGVKVHIPAESDLCKQLFMYAFEEKEKHMFMKKVQMIQGSLNNQINKYNSEAEINIKKREQSIGAMQAISEVIRIWD